ncbi:MAG: transposase, partial [Candidatus Heimdallarchaeaceae archaeon]
NSMVHNFWSHRYLVQRIKYKAEEYGMKVSEEDESYTSSICPKCGSSNVIKRKRLFKCLDCTLEAHRDAVGCVNIRLAHTGGEVANWSLASPLLLSLEVGTSHASA